MRHYLALSFLVLFGLLSLGRAQTPVWSQFASSPAGTSPRCDDVHFVDPLHGWVARATDGIFRTTNGGLTFTKVLSSAIPYPGTTLTAHFRSINFASPMRGWAGNLGPGSYDSSVTDTNLLYETFDGGLTWSPVAAINASGMKGFCSIQVFDAQHIYGGGRVRGPAHFAWSTDGGTNWSVTNLTAAGVMGGIMDVYFKDPLNGFLVGMDTNEFTANCVFPYRGTIARTTDGGLTWSNVVTTSIPCSYFWKMSWPSSQVGYVSLQQNGAHDTVVFYKTTDGGTTWVSNGIPIVNIGGPSFGLQGIGFVSETEGWMGGSASVAAPFNFIHTTDGGQTWTAVGYENTQQINRIRFLNASFGYASGRKVQIYRVPLAVVASPTNQIIAVGDDVTFSVAAQGVAPLSYQWRFHGTNLPGANAEALTITNAQPENIGPYSVVVSDYSGSVTSAMANLSLIGVVEPPVIVSQPESVDTMIGATVTFSVAVTGTAPMDFYWRFNGNDIEGATNGSLESALIITNAQLTDAGGYSVIVSNSAGAVTSAVAQLTFNRLFQDDFDGYEFADFVFEPMTANGYKIFFNAVAGPSDFFAGFGYDYSEVLYPTQIPPAPNSRNGTTKGLVLYVNKDNIAAAAAVNLYPVNGSFRGNFALKFDLWMNWSSGSTTEHALFGINHSGNVTNRISLPTSDGLFFALDGDGGVAATAAALRDFAVYRGGGPGEIPILLTPNNTTFGPTPLLGARFDGSDAGIAALFPAKTIPGWITTQPGVAGIEWIQVEVRQVNNLITYLLNGTAIAQYTNTSEFTEGNIMIGLNDAFDSIGNGITFVIFDNLRVERIEVAPVQLLTPGFVGENFTFSFATEKYETYTVQRATSLSPADWMTLTNLVGDGELQVFATPISAGSGQRYFRVTRP